MGNKFGCGEKSLDPDSAWKLQNKEMAENPMYKFADLARGGRLVKAYVDHGPDRVKEIARTEMVHYLYNGGKGDTISKVDYVRWCAMMRAKAMVSISYPKGCLSKAQSFPCKRYSSHIKFCSLVKVK